MNRNLQDLGMCLRLAIEDDELTANDVLTEIGNVLAELEGGLRVKAEKASMVANSFTHKDEFSDFIVRPKEDDAYDPFSVYGNNPPVIYGGMGTDTISLGGYNNDKYQ